jgi:hypothetical protein
MVDRHGTNLLRRHLLVGFSFLFSSSARWVSESILTDSRYVAMHAMQSVNAPTPFEHADDFDDASLTPYAAPQPQKRGLEVFLMVVGMMLPLLTQIGHAHAHGA